MLFPPEEVYEAILREITKECNERQIGRSNPRVVKTVQRKYPILSKRHRKRGVFGFKKSQTEKLRPAIVINVRQVGMPK